MVAVRPSARHACTLTALIFAVACGPSHFGTGDQSDPFNGEHRGGKLHDVALAGFDIDSFERGGVPSGEALSQLFDAAVSDTGEALSSISVDEFEVISSSTEITPAGMRIAHVRLRQHVGGVPLWGTHLSMTAKGFDARGEARLLASSHHVYDGVNVPTEPKITVEAAATLARAANRMIGSATVAESKLVLWPLEGGLDLVWSIKLEGSYYRALVYASGSLESRVIRVDERHYQTAGTVSGDVAFGGAPGGNGVATPTPLPRLEVSSGDLATTTDGLGTYVLDVDDGAPITATLAGLSTITINDQTGLSTSAGAPAAAVTDITIGESGNVLAVANNTAYFFIDQTHQYLINNGVEDPALLALTTNTNIADACNAFYTASSLNFFQAGAIGSFECNNTAEATIVVHEYGHFVDDVFGGITNSGLSEGWGDLLACFISQAPDVGPDFFVGNDSPLRTCDNDYQFPPDGNDEVHELGQAWAGFGWHAREGLIAALGEEEGDALARALILPSLPSNAANIPAAVREAFIRDDDDGNLENSTPHFDILLEAAARHNLAFVVEDDLVSPSAIADLAIADSTPTTATLSWTAPGDDGDEGVATSYDVRASLEPITDTNFAQAFQLQGPEPLEAGNTQTLTINLVLVPGATVFFAIKTIDEQLNTSAISNVVDVTTGEGNEVYSESFENGDGGWEAIGLWHLTERKASDGATAFWYGNEATGNYNTGAANSGELLSPPIDLTGAENPNLVYDTEFDVEAGNAFDKMTITVFDAEDPTINVTVEEVDGASGGFIPRGISLAGMSDRVVRVRFSFDTVDAVGNDTEGWFVDRVRIVSDNELGAPALMINEILADPGSFDANNDGAVSFRDDEFLELVNVGDGDLDLSGATISDRVRVRFTFPAGTVLSPGQAVVVFGGGTPNIGALTFTASNSLALNNTGDTITVRAADGAELAAASYGREGGRDESLNRETDGDASAALVLHTTLAEAVASPGTKVDGTPFDGAPVGAVLMINEVLTNPGTVIDANGDGAFDSTEDEFIEIVNIGDEEIDLSGATYSDFFGPRLTLANGTVLPAGGALLIFGGGTPDAASFDGVTVVTAGGALFLNNGGDTITLAAADGAVLATATVDDSDNHSLNRATDLDTEAEFVAHDSIAGVAASPGLRVDGTSF